MEVLLLFTFSRLQLCAYHGLALFDERLLDCVDAGQGEVFGNFHDDLLEDLLALHDLAEASLLDAALASGVVDLHLVRRVLNGLHAVNNQVDFEVVFGFLFNLDMGLDVLSHGKVIGCDLIDFFNELTSPKLRNFLLVGSDLQCLLIVLSRDCFDCIQINLVDTFEMLLWRRTERFW